MSDETKVFPTIDPAIFRRQMRTFDQMREIEKRFQERAAAARTRDAHPHRPVTGRAAAFPFVIWNTREVGQA